MTTSSARSSTRIAPWTVLVVLAVIGGVLISAYLLLTRREMSVLFEELRPAEAAAVVAELEADAVPYELRDGGTTILTPAEKRDAIRIKLESSELPVQGIEGFELFDTSDLGLTEFAQRIKYQRALQGELARTIMKMEGVIEARIHLSIPERSVFRSEQSPAKAAVTVLTKAGEARDPAMIAGIQQLVAAAVPDLASQDVVVLDDHGAVISLAPSDDAASIPAGMSDLLAAVRAVVPDGNANILVETSLEVSRAGNSLPEQPATPAARQLRIITPGALPQDAQNRVADTIRSMASAPELSSLPVAFGVSSPPPLLPTPAPQALARRQIDAEAQGSPAPEAVSSGASLIIVLAGLAIVGLALVGGSVAVFRARSSGLSLQDQRRFAERLRIGLQSSSPEAADAAL